MTDNRAQHLTERRARLVKLLQWANGEYAESLEQQIQIIDRQLEYINLQQKGGE